MRALTGTNIAQNEEVKKISWWAAILLPDFRGDHLRHEFPAYAGAYDYPLAPALMVVTSLVLYLFFRRRGWL